MTRVEKKTHAIFCAKLREWFRTEEDRTRTYEVFGDVGLNIIHDIFFL